MTDIFAREVLFLMISRYYQYCLQLVRHKESDLETVAVVDT